MGRDRKDFLGAPDEFVPVLIRVFIVSREFCEVGRRLVVNKQIVAPSM
jgi:hypothetical protein